MLFQKRSENGSSIDSENALLNLAIRDVIRQLAKIVSTWTFVEAKVQVEGDKVTPDNQGMTCSGLHLIQFGNPSGMFLSVLSQNALLFRCKVKQSHPATFFQCIYLSREFRT